MKRETLSMDRGWRFHRGDVPYPKYRGHDALYTATKTACSKGAGRRDFDDSAWRVVDLPHDLRGDDLLHLRLQLGVDERAVGGGKRV